MSTTEQTTDIQVADNAPVARGDYDFSITKPDAMSVGNIIALAKLAAKGGMSDPKGAEGLAIRAVFGLQMGFTPVEGMQGLYLIEGKPVVGGQLLAKRIRQSGVYDYKIVKHDNTECQLEAFRIVDGKRESLGMAGFTMEQARAAGLVGKAIWQKYPENMLFARAMANLYRFHCPDLIGMPFATEGEEIVAEEPAVVDTATKAMAAATEKVKARTKKDEPKKDDNVIEATFTEDNPVPEASAVTAPAEAAATVAPATPTTEDAPAPAEAPAAEEEAPTISNGGKGDPFEDGASKPEWVEEGRHVALNKFKKEGADEDWFEIVVKATGSAIPNFAGKNPIAMTDALAKVDKAFELSDAELTKAAKVDNLDGKIAAGVLSLRPAAPKEPAPTVKDMKEGADSEHKARAEELRAEIGDTNLAGIVAFADKKGADVFARFLAEKMPEIRATEAYQGATPDNKSNKASMGLMSWVKTLGEGQ